MILLPCPWCGPRDAGEFGYVGEVGARPDPRTATPERWREYLYLRANVAGWGTERWYHRMGCRRYLTVERNTTTNEVRSATDAGEGASADASGQVIEP
ncbi:MAG: sarcosine oxidase subunit delta [Nocardioidaceae bacterium]|nr:sarcosine oxidase subunit delta [Nocardioidaceae bacterium]